GILQALGENGPEPRVERRRDLVVEALRDALLEGLRISAPALRGGREPFQILVKERIGGRFDEPFEQERQGIAGAAERLLEDRGDRVPGTSAIVAIRLGFEAQTQCAREELPLLRRAQ